MVKLTATGAAREEWQGGKADSGCRVWYDACSDPFLRSIGATQQSPVAPPFMPSGIGVFSAAPQR